MWQERHMKNHDIVYRLLILWSAMETHSCIIMDAITAVRWKQTTLVNTGCIWKRKQLHKSHYETRVYFLSWSYRDAVQWTATSSLHPATQPRSGAGLNVRMVLRHKSLCAEKLNNYWRLLFLIFVFAVYKRTLSCAVGSRSLFLYIRSICLDLQATL